MENKNKILLVEDDVFIQDIYLSRLKQEGFNVLAAEHGVAALEKMKDFNPDLIVLDIITPYMNGLEFLKTVRKEDKWKKIPVIMMSNLSEKEKIKEMQQLEISAYLVKSHFTPSEVMEKIKTLLAA